MPCISLFHAPYNLVSQGVNSTTMLGNFVTFKKKVTFGFLIIFVYEITMAVKKI